MLSGVAHAVGLAFGDCRVRSASTLAVVPLLLALIPLGLVTVLCEAEERDDDHDGIPDVYKRSGESGH